MAQIPVKTVASTKQFTEEAAQVYRDSLDCIQAFYLEHAALNQNTCDALMNALQLNHDNYIEIDDPQFLSKELVKAALQKPHLSAIFSEDMKLYTQDILFKKK